MSVRRIAGAHCCVCAISAEDCGTESQHRELRGVVMVRARWICAECTRLANARWIVAAKAAVQS